MGGFPSDWKSSHFISGNLQKACFGFFPTDDGINGPKSCCPKVEVGRRSAHNNFLLQHRSAVVSENESLFPSMYCFASIEKVGFSQSVLIRKIRLILLILFSKFNTKASQSR